jgi:hypothetical protein
VAQNTTYPFMMTKSDADEAYTNLVYETSRQRITLAGYRLANFVIDIYESNSTKALDFEDLDELKNVKDMFMNHAKQNEGKL